MTLTGIRPDDIVLCDVKGRRFHAVVVTGADDAGLPIAPITRGITYRHVAARQVVEHWRKAGRPRRNRKLEQGT